MSVRQFARDWLVGPVVHVAAWIGAYYAILGVLAGTSGVDAYALLSGWWFALYADYVMSVKLRSALVAFVICFVLSAGSSLFIADFAEDWGAMLPVLAAVQAAIFVSPLILAALTRKVVTVIGLRSSKSG